MSRKPAVYILASGRNGMLYIGVTSNLPARVWEHKQGRVVGFTQRYRAHRLVWYALLETMPEAIALEKQMKGWHRAWKLKVIEAMNPDWRDLYRDLTVAD